VESQWAVRINYVLVDCVKAIAIHRRRKAIFKQLYNNRYEYEAEMM